VRVIAALAAAALLALTPSALGVSSIVGGAAVDVRAAPWSALVLYFDGSDGALCSAAIIDPTHVVTAAHCVVRGTTPVSESSLFVRAGVTNAAAPAASDHVQDRRVHGIRVHRGYASEDRSGGDDVAVLTLSSALDLSGPTARAIALPSASLELELGAAVILAGYGLKSRGGTIDGTLNGMNGTLVDQSQCLTESNTSNAVLLCAFSGSSSPCGGDSGAALVLERPTPVLIGVTRAAACSSNSIASFANVTAPEILHFVQGSDDPPMAPRPTSPSSIAVPTPLVQVGQTVHCKPGEWTGKPTFSYAFYEATTHQVLRRGSSAYTLRVGDAGRRIFCRVTASNAGGSGFDESTPISSVRNGGELEVPATTARRGGTALLRVELVDWVRPLRAVTVCAKLAANVGGRVCRSTSPTGVDPAVVLRVGVKASAPLARARVIVTARATDGRAAWTSGHVTIR
jgi:trypsin